jgi:hypothetical protein
MKAYRAIMSAALGGLLCLPVPLSAQSVRIYTQKIPAEQICGTMFAKYRCSTTWASMALTQSDIPLQLKSVGVPNYAQVLGRMYEGRVATAVSTAPCGTVSEEDFAPPSAATSFDYKKKASSEFGAGTNIDVKSALAAAGVPAGDLDNLQAQFEATYGRKAKAEYSLKGKYFRRELHFTKLDQIKAQASASTGLQACGDALRASDSRNLIYSIAVVQLDKATFVSDVANDIAASFAAKVKTKNQSADVAALTLSVKSRIEASLSTEMEPEWRVISWDYLHLGAPLGPS